jgi:Arc/MetJ-type ribon-helix-helix transcriptional regulator
MMPSMVTGMATTKVTVTLENDQVARIREQVAAGRAASVSGFVQRAVATALDEMAAWAAELTNALAATGGPLTDEERAWADQVLATAEAAKTDSAA